MKIPSMNWFGEDFHKEFQVCKTLAKKWLETKGVLDGIQYQFILQLLGMEDFHQWQSFPLVTPDNNDKEDPKMVQEAFKGYFWQTF